MRGINEELRFLDQLQRTVSIDGIACTEKLLRLEHVFSKFSAGIFVPEELRFIETAGELGEDLIFVFRNAGILCLDQPLRRTHHRSISSFRGILRATAVEEQLSLEQLAFAGSQGKLSLTHDLAGTLADSHVHQGKFPGVTPIAIVRAIHVVTRNLRQILQQILDVFFANAPDEILEALVLQALAYVVLCYRQHCLRYPLRGNGADGDAILSGIVMKFSSENHLEMRHLEPLHVAVDAVKADISNAMLATGIKAAADFDAQTLHRLIEL